MEKVAEIRKNLKKEWKVAAEDIEKHEREIREKAEQLRILKVLLRHAKSKKDFAENALKELEEEEASLKQLMSENAPSSATASRVEMSPPTPASRELQDSAPMGPPSLTEPKASESVTSPTSISSFKSPSTYGDSVSSEQAVNGDFFNKNNSTFQGSGRTELDSAPVKAPPQGGDENSLNQHSAPSTKSPHVPALKTKNTAPPPPVHIVHVAKVKGTEPHSTKHDGYSDANPHTRGTTSDTSTLHGPAAILDAPAEPLESSAVSFRYKKAMRPRSVESFGPTSTEKSHSIAGREDQLQEADSFHVAAQALRTTSSSSQKYDSSDESIPSPSPMHQSTRTVPRDKQHTSSELSPEERRRKSALAPRRMLPIPQTSGQSEVKKWTRERVEKHYDLGTAQLIGVGGNKTVYKVKRRTYDENRKDEDQWEAVSVMSGAKVSESQVMDEAATAKTLTGIPNFVQFRGVFSVDDKHPFEQKAGLFYCLRTELCGGDLENYIKPKGNELSVPVAKHQRFVRCILVQVASALWTANKRFHFLHNDLKLNNVLFKTPLKTLTRRELACTVGGKRLGWILPPSAVDVKMTDYGSSTIQSGVENTSITDREYSTAENLAPELYYATHHAKRGMAINLFSLGVATMHVASSGDRPYEEIFCEEEVFCPLALKADLILEWNKEGYSTIRTFLEVLGDDASTVFDTLYRYCVIFDLEENFVKRYKENAVVKLLVKHLKGEPSPTEVRQSARLKENAKKVIRKFENHRAQLGLCRDGLVQPRHPYFARVQSVLQESGGLDLLFRMCDFNPETRISLEDILQHEFLDCFRSDDESHDDTAGSDSDSDFSDADE